MAYVLIGMLQALTEFGFDVALIQKQDAGDAHYNTAWTFNVIFGVSSAVILVVLAWPAALFYDEPRITLIVLALSLTLALRGFENIGIVDFRKQLQFQREFLFHALIKVFSFVVTITIAVLTRSYWALVIGTLTSSVVSLILSYVLHDYRPRFTTAKRGELFSFSVWLFLNNILLFVRTRGADLIVGKLLGPFNLGLFTVGQEISSLTTEQLIAPINRATFPGYAKMSHELARLAEAFLNVTSMIALIAFPAAVGIAVVSVQAVPLLLGGSWLGAIPLIEILALVGIISALHSNTGVVYIALGKPRIHVILQSGSATILFPLAIYLIHEIGIVGMAYAYLIANGLSFLVNCVVAVRVIGVKPMRLINSIVRPMLASFCMYASVRWLQGALPADTPLIGALILCIVSGALVFAVVLLSLWLLSGRPEGAETIALNHARKIQGARALADALLPAT
jgi:O-antigen/teichoic acid export membrane protein